jgi:small subunit ribosomal protein S11
MATEKNEKKEPEKVEKPAKAEKAEKAEKAPKGEKPEKGEKGDKAEAPAEGGAPVKAPRIKKGKKVDSRGVAHVKASFNNTMVTMTTIRGEVISVGSAGTVGFKGTRKSTPFAAQRAAEQASQLAQRLGLREVEVKVKGAGSGRESAVRAIANSGLKVVSIEDVTPLPHNGCRARKRRRV